MKKCPILLLAPSIGEDILGRNAQSCSLRHLSANKSNEEMPKHAPCAIYWRRYRRKKCPIMLLAPSTGEDIIRRNAQSCSLRHLSTNKSNEEMPNYAPYAIYWRRYRRKKCPILLLASSIGEDIVGRNAQSCSLRHLLAKIM